MEGVCDAKASYSYDFDRGGMFTGHVTGVKPASTVPMFRLYNPNSGEHFYTGNAAEKNHLAAIGWKSARKCTLLFNARIFSRSGSTPR